MCRKAVNTSQSDSRSSIWNKILKSLSDFDIINLFDFHAHQNGREMPPMMKFPLKKSAQY